MTAATNEDCLGWLLENCCLMGQELKLLTGKDLLMGIFLMEEMSKFLAVG